MKKISALLVATIIFALYTSAAAIDIESGFSFPAQIWETGYVVVENGEPRSITAEEYHSITRDAVIEPDNEGSNFSYIPSLSYRYVNLTSTTKYLSSKYRVSPLYVSKDTTSMSVTETCTITQSVTKSAGLNLTSNIKSLILSAGAVNFGYSKTESSATGSSVSGTFLPKKDYTYSAIVFQPRVHVVTGDVEYWSTYQGVQELIGTYKGVTCQYPVTSSKGFLDGVYSVMGGNSTSVFPDMP